MGSHRWIIWIGVLLIFLYTIGFALVQREEKNTLGAWAVLIVALTALVIPFFTILR